MADHSIANLKTGVEDLAPKFGMPPGLEARFGRSTLGLEKSGLTYFKLLPDFKVPWGHRHKVQEEIYLVVSGTAVVTFEDETVELGAWDAIRVPAEVARSFQAGAEGAELIAFGAGEQGDAEMIKDFWEDS